MTNFFCTVMGLILILNWGQTFCSETLIKKWFKPEENWVLRQKKDGISVYHRFVAVDGNRRIRVVRSFMVLDQPKSRLFFAITDEKVSREWIPRVKQYYQVRTQKKNNWLVYTQLHMPWPFKSVDFVADYRLKGENRPVTTIHIESNAGALPKRRSVKRVGQFQGKWVLEARPNGKTAVMYELFSTEPPEYPRWVTDPIVTRNMLQNMAALRGSVMENLTSLPTTFKQTGPGTIKGN